MPFKYTRAELKARIAALEAEVARLLAENTTLTGDNSTQRARVAELEGNVAWLQGEITRLGNENANLLVINSGLNAEKVALAASNAALIEENEGLEQALAAAEAEIQRLKDLYEPPAPVYDFIGYCPNNNTPAEVARLCAYNGGSVRRSYLPPPYPGHSFPTNPTFLGDTAAGLRTAHTMKGLVPQGTSSTMKNRLERLLTGLDDEKWIAYILKSAKNSVWGCEHEPEDDFAAGGWDKNLYRRGQRKFSQLVREANRRDGGQRLVSMNLMSVTDSGSEVAQWYPGDGYLDVLGFDGYNWPSREPGRTEPEWASFESIFEPDFRTTQSLGLQFAIFEFGCRKDGLFEEVDNENPPTAENSAKQVTWLKTARKLMDERYHPVVATYFHHDWWLLLPEGHRAMESTRT